MVDTNQKQKTVDEQLYDLNIGQVVQNRALDEHETLIGSLHERQEFIDDRQDSLEGNILDIMEQLEAGNRVSPWASRKLWIFALTGLATLLSGLMGLVPSEFAVAAGTILAAIYGVINVWQKGVGKTPDGFS